MRIRKERPEEGMCLFCKELVTDGRNRIDSNNAPRTIGSSSSRLMTLIDGSHYDAKVTDHQKKVIQLWIDTSATYPGTYASLGCGDYPVRLPYGAMVNQCGGCHIREIKDKQGKPRKVLNFPGSGNKLETLSNLDYPEKSYALLAPLAKEAGGLGLCKEAVFADKENPLYKAMLAAITDAHDRLQEGKRFDMPGFRPNEHYIREMQRFGILPADLKPTDPIDIYATDHAYWSSFDHRPSEN